MAILKDEGFADVKSLGERLFASQPTIRRDLDRLEKDGLVRRSHGGAVPAGDMVNTPVAYRRGKRVKEKMHIARLAADLIENDQMIFADASSTILYLVEHIKEHDHMSVVTNSIPLCQALSGQNVQVYCTGGKLFHEPMGFVGRAAERATMMFHANLFFFSSASLSEDGMISDYSEEENDLRVVMQERSDKTVYLCDSAKFGRTSPFCVFELCEVDYVVTDAALSERILQKQGFRLLKAGEGAFLYERI